METINISNNAAEYINELQNSNETYSLHKENIANSLSAIAEMICCGRDSEDIAAHTDELLSTMRTIADYNTLLDNVSATSDRTAGRFVYQPAENNKKATVQPLRHKAL